MIFLVAPELVDEQELRRTYERCANSLSPPERLRLVAHFKLALRNLKASVGPESASKGANGKGKGEGKGNNLEKGEGKGA